MKKKKKKYKRGETAKEKRALEVKRTDRINRIFVLFDGEKRGKAEKIWQK